MATLEKIMHMGEEIEVGGGGFKEIDNVIYNRYGCLTGFTGDGKNYELKYNEKVGGLCQIKEGSNIYNITRGGTGKLISIEKE